MTDEQKTDQVEEYTPKTDQEIRQLALDVAGGRVFLTTDPDEIKLSFGVIIAFLNEEHRKDMEERDIVAFYEYMADAGPRSINGLPMFFSAKLLTRDEYNRLVDAHKEVKAFREKFVGESEKEVQP